MFFIQIFYSVESWKHESCGLHITNITFEEQGIWRLTSTNDNNNIARGAIIINVRGKQIFPIFSM